MVEAEWLACTDPRWMLDFLRTKTTNRKRQLFVCACARQAFGGIANERSGNGIDALERVADGLANRTEFEAAAIEIRSVFNGTYYSRPTPDAPPFVTEGSLVTPETTVGLSEVLKLFNDHFADAFGIIAEALVANAESVQYGSVLYRLIPGVTIGN